MTCLNVVLFLLIVQPSFNLETLFILSFSSRNALLLFFKLFPGIYSPYFVFLKLL